MAAPDNAWLEQQMLAHHGLLTTQAMHSQHQHTEAVLQAFTESVVAQLRESRIVCQTRVPPYYLPLLKEILQTAPLTDAMSHRLKALIDTLEEVTTNDANT